MAPLISFMSDVASATNTRKSGSDCSELLRDVGCGGVNQHLLHAQASNSCAELCASLSGSVMSANEKSNQHRGGAYSTTLASFGGSIPSSIRM
jgi:hypothetical protein